MDDFEVFDRYHSRSVKDIFVTIQRRGNFSLNRAAFHALGSPQFVELLFNRSKRLIGFRPTDRDNVHGVPVRKQGSSDSYMIAGLTFTKEYDIDTSTARRYSAKMQENVLIVDLKGASIDATGPRLRDSTSSQTYEEQYPLLDQQADEQMAIADNKTVADTKPTAVTQMTLTSTKDFGNAFEKALMQLGEDQKKLILEHLLNEANHRTGEA